MADAAMGMSAMLPPEIRAQGQAPQGPAAFMQAGQAAQGPGAPIGGDPIALLEQKIVELERWTSDMASLVQTIHPPAGALLVPIAQAGKAFQAQIQQLRQRMGGSAAAQVSAPRPTPAEGAPVRPAV